MKKELQAVALKYPENSYAPFVSAVGTKINAQKILEIAKENEIPIVEDEDLTQILCAQEIGSFIPEETWSAVAAIFSFLVDVQKNQS